MERVRARPTIVHGPAPVGPVAITAERYVSREWMERERQALWPRTWLLAGLERDVLHPGDFFVFNVGDESILVARSQHGDLNAFLCVGHRFPSARAFARCRRGLYAPARSSFS